MKRSSLVLALYFATLCLFIAASCSQKSTNDNSSVATTPTTANNPNAPVSPASSAADKPKEAPPLAKPKPGAISVTAVELFKEYESNEEAADKKYKNKDLAVTGRVGSYTVDDEISMYLDAGGTSSVSCYFDIEQKENVFRLKKGQKVTLQCEGDGKNYNPSLKNCAVQSAE